MSDLTYLGLINQVTGRLKRDDLDTVAREAIQDRIEHYGKEFFYSAEFVDTSITTVAGTRLYDLPARWASVVRVQVLNGVWVPVHRLPHTVINAEDNLPSPLPGLPFHWCLFGGQIRIWPCGGGYNLQLTMNRSPAAPVADGDVTFWSTDAQSLIINAACELICQEHINDPVRAAQYKPRRIDDEHSLNSKSIREMGGIQIRGRL